MNDQPIEALLDELDALQKKAVDLPYFVGSDTAEDCSNHRNSGLALVDTGRSGDWPVARLCEWHTAEFIAETANAYPRLSRELRQRIEREQWQPIETAPKESRQLLVARIIEGEVYWACTARWSNEYQCWFDGIETGGLAGPTHWMYVPSQLLRQQLEQQQQSEVEAALAELRRMDFRAATSISFHDFGAIKGCEGNGYVLITIDDAEHGIGATLEEAMQKVRQWKEESSKELNHGR